ncbi:hypothetical protein EAE96_006946 [Botrytis aclada]|nr:hypothetical protein EAE96_006946 [Botrytis aclada]
MPPVPKLSRMLSPPSSPDASPREAAEFTTGGFESNDSSSQSSRSETSQGMRTSTQSPTFESFNPATNGSDSNQTLTSMNPVSDSSTAAARSGIPDTLQPRITRNGAKKFKEMMDLDEPQVASSRPAKDAISNTNSKKRQSHNDKSHQAGTSHSAKKPKKNAGLVNDDLDKKNIIPHTKNSIEIGMPLAKNRCVEKEIETTNDNVNESHTAAQERNYLESFRPEPFDGAKLVSKMKRENKRWVKLNKKRKCIIPLGNAQYIWLQTQPKSIRDEAEKRDREGTSDPIGTYSRKVKEFKANGEGTETITTFHYLSQFLEDRHTPMSEAERKRLGMTGKTFTFKCILPASALVQCSPCWKNDSTEQNVTYIEIVLETKSKKNFKLKAKIQRKIERHMKRKEDAAVAEKVAMGLPAASIASYRKSFRKHALVGRDLKMLPVKKLPSD